MVEENEGRKEEGLDKTALPPEEKMRCTTIVR
jgi:hypothetical protein